MRAMRPGAELILAILAVVAVIGLTRDVPRGAAPPTAAELRHNPATCVTCIHPNAFRKGRPFAESELASASPRSAPAW
jgi:hypothetical protein